MSYERTMMSSEVTAMIHLFEEAAGLGISE